MFFLTEIVCGQFCVWAIESRTRRLFFSQIFESALDWGNCGFTGTKGFGGYVIYVVQSRPETISGRPILHTNYSILSLNCSTTTTLILKKTQPF